jgi:hypothetical protein
MNEIETMRALAEKLEDAAQKIRAAIAVQEDELVRFLVEKYTAGPRPKTVAATLFTTASPPQPHGEGPVDSAFANLKKADAVECILKEMARPMEAVEIFDVMKQRGHPVATANSLRSMMSETKERFVSVGGGKWNLKQADLIPASHPNDIF